MWVLSLFYSAVLFVPSRQPWYADWDPNASPQRDLVEPCELWIATALPQPNLFCISDGHLRELQIAPEYQYWTKKGLGSLEVTDRKQWRALNGSREHGFSTKSPWRLQRPSGNYSHSATKCRDRMEAFLSVISRRPLLRSRSAKFAASACSFLPFFAYPLPVTPCCLTFFFSSLYYLTRCGFWRRNAVSQHHVMLQTCYSSQECRSISTLPSENTFVCLCSSLEPQIVLDTQTYSQHLNLAVWKNGDALPSIMMRSSGASVQDNCGLRFFRGIASNIVNRYTQKLSSLHRSFSSTLTDLIPIGRHRNKYVNRHSNSFFSLSWSLTLP